MPKTNDFKKLLREIRKLDLINTNENILLKYENMINSLGLTKLAKLLIKKGILTEKEFKKIDHELARELFKERDKIRKEIKEIKRSK